MNEIGDKTAIGVAESHVEFEGKLTKVVVNDFSNLCFIVVTDVGKIGQLTQIDWPIDTLGQCRHSSAVYNSKLLLGVENPESEIVVRKLVEAVAAKKGRSKQLLIGTAFESPSPEQISLVCDALRSLL